MSELRVRFRVHTAEELAGYVRHARTETLKALGIAARPALVEPIPSAVYLVAYDALENVTLGLAEVAFVHQLYPRYEDAPYAGLLELHGLCAYEHLAGVRTIYVEPAYRSYHALYLKLLFGQVQLFAALGAEYAVATTSSTHDGLRKLYERTGGTRVGVFALEAAADPVALFLFSIGALAKHPLAARYTPRSEHRLDRASTVAGPRVVP